MNTEVGKKTDTVENKREENERIVIKIPSPYVLFPGQKLELPIAEGMEEQVIDLIGRADAQLLVYSKTPDAVLTPRVGTLAAMSYKGASFDNRDQRSVLELTGLAREEIIDDIKWGAENTPANITSSFNDSDSSSLEYAAIADNNGIGTTKTKTFATEDIDQTQDAAISLDESTELINHYVDMMYGPDYAAQIKQYIEEEIRKKDDNLQHIVGLFAATIKGHPTSSAERLYEVLKTKEPAAQFTLLQPIIKDAIEDAESYDLFPENKKDAQATEVSDDARIMIFMDVGVLFPGCVLPITYTHKTSIDNIKKTVEAAQKEHDGECLLYTLQEDENAPFDVGTMAKIVSFEEIPNEEEGKESEYVLTVEGIGRRQLGAWMEKDGLTYTEHSPYYDQRPPNKKRDIISDLLREGRGLITDCFYTYEFPHPYYAIEQKNLVEHRLQSESNFEKLAGIFAYPLQRFSNSYTVVQTLRDILTTRANDEQLKKMNDLLLMERNRLAEANENSQQTLKWLYDSLDPEDFGGTDATGDTQEFADKIKTLKLSDEAKKIAKKELKRLQQMQTGSAEHGVVTHHLEHLLNMPWGEVTETNTDMAAAEQILNDSHYGMDNAKEKILDYLASVIRTGNQGGTIICLEGPPGIGKTSIVEKGIAEALGRKYHRIALGGVRDEAEIRGHRKTYVGAFPGRIAKAFQAVGVDNPVLLFDEVDKLANDHRGDPASALLEAFDPEQNNTFQDHYLDVPYDLSKAIIVCTANDWHAIPTPLQDRMQRISLPGYVPEYKIEIARRHLLPPVKEKEQLTDDQLIVDEDVFKKMAEEYSVEAGVRQYKRDLETICRKANRQILKGAEQVHVTESNLTDFIGKPRRKIKKITPDDHEVGVVNGLAWTPTGGTILKVEVVEVPGLTTEFKTNATGQLGDVMKESTSISRDALAAKVKAGKINLDLEAIKKSKVSIHFPAGAIPKDGPSAGITIFTGLCSVLGNIKVRQDIAMTGELSLQGHVLPIGGVGSKVSAAYASGIKKVILPKENEDDYHEEVPQTIRNKMEAVFVSEVEEVLDHALVGGLEALEPKPVAEQDNAPSAPVSPSSARAFPGSRP